MARLRRLVVAGATVALLLLSSAGPVSAGGSGEQLEFIDNLGYVYSVCVYGQNQNLQWTTKCFSTPFTTNMLANWWWQGQIQITEYDINGFQVGTQYTFVWPVPYHDWWCFDDSTGNGSAC